MKTNNFRGDVTDVSAETQTLDQAASAYEYYLGRTIPKTEEAM